MIDGQLFGLLVALLAAGAATGFAAGLFGIGGGSVLVPALSFVFVSLGYPDDVIMHCTVATSSAVIIVSSIRSVNSHHKHGAVDWDVLWPKRIWRSWALWIGLGALVGATYLAKHMTSRQLEFLFGGVMIFIALQFTFGRPDFRLRDTLPGGAAPAVVGGTIGALSALMGIGGGAFTVTLMSICGKTIHRAIGTASGIGMFIAVPATLGFIISGQGIEGRPPLSWGYVNLLGFAVMASTSILFIPLGARTAHNTNQKKLKIVFGIFLIIVSLRMIRKALIA